MHLIHLMYSEYLMHFISMHIAMNICIYMFISIFVLKYILFLCQCFVVVARQRAQKKGVMATMIVDQNEDLEVKERVCRHCHKVYIGTKYGLCSRCGRFQLKGMYVS